MATTLLSDSNDLGFFAAASHIQPDAIFALTAEYMRDASDKKVNMGQGAYRDEQGNPWVLPSVKAAHNYLHENFMTHEYLPILGLPEFRIATAETVLGKVEYEVRKDKVSN